jgi:hypothetical protein
MIKTRQELLEFHHALCAEALSLMDKKNQDYTGAASGEDPFFNFRRVVEEGHVSTLPKSVYVRLSDKMARISTLLSRPAAVSDERLRDTVSDAINYLILLLATSLGEPSTPDVAQPPEGAPARGQRASAE